MPATINGLTIATEIIGSTHYQQWKIMDGTVGSEVPIKGSAASGLYVDPRASVTTATPVAVTATRTSTTLKALNTARRAISIYNASNEWLWVRFGSGASLALATVGIAPDGYWESTFNCTDIVTGIWADSGGAISGSAFVTEY